MMRKWAKEVLKLPDEVLPGGRTGGIVEFAKAGIVVSGASGTLPLTNRLITVASGLAAKNGHRQVAVAWPSTALPPKWGVKQQDPQPKNVKTSSTCKECGA